MARVAIGLVATLWLLSGASGVGAQSPAPNDGARAILVHDHDGERFGRGDGDRFRHGDGDFRFRHFRHDRFRDRFFFFGGNFYDPGFYPYAYYPPQVWYWCANPPGYYPYVPQCAVPWQPVPGQ